MIKVLLFIFCGFPIVTIGQNLVPNAGFESMHECPVDYNKVGGAFWATDWYAANGGTPDYFHPCSKLSGVPLNWMGYAEAIEGMAYAGIIVCMRRVDPKQIAYREYIGVKLIEPLKSGISYRLSAKVRLGLSCFATCNGLGMLLTEKSIQSSGTVNFPLAPQICMMQPVTDKKSWITLSGDFIAQGGEQYLTIGNFLSDQQIIYREFDENFIETPDIAQYAYFYLDDIMVEKNQVISVTTDTAAIVKVPERFQGQLPAGKKLVLDHLLFAIDSAKILPQSYMQLDELAAAMQKTPTVKIVISGHTDNTGQPAYNLQLSIQRAEAVRNYLLGKGISRFRILAKGFGNTLPVADNSTENGRALNRRVEIEVQE